MDIAQLLNNLPQDALIALITQAAQQQPEPVDELDVLRARFQNAHPVTDWEGGQERYCVFDIETGNAPLEVIEQKKAQKLKNFKGNNGATKPETIEKQRLEFEKELNDGKVIKGGLLDESPILCVALVTENEKCLFNGMGGDLTAPEGWSISNHSNEQEFLEETRIWLDAKLDEETVIIAHNGLQFDIPKMRNAYIRHKMTIPRVFRNLRQPVFDTQDKYRLFSFEYNGIMPSLETVALAMGFPSPKENLSGAMVPVYHEAGRHQEIVDYCALDTETCAKVYLSMVA